MYHQLDQFLIKYDFVKIGHDSCVYILDRNEEVILYLLLYDDDILMKNSSKKDISKSNETKMILGVYITRNCNRNELFLSILVT